MTQARTDTGREFWAGGSGKWAGEQLVRALKAGKGITPNALRTNATLRKDEWIHLDTALVEEGMIRLQGVADLLGAGLTRPVQNAMGKTVFEYEKVTDMNPAEVSLDGNSRSENDRQEFELDSVPLPLTHKDFNIDLRTLEASRNTGESLDTTQIRTAGRLIAEETELMLFQGGKQFGGKAIWGYTNFPDRNQVTYGTNGAWSAAAKTGEDILADVLTMIAAAQADRYYGPYWIYVDSASSVKLEDDYKDESDKTIRQRILEVNQVSSIRVVDQMPANHTLLVQATLDVAAMVTGIPLQTIQWDINGGFKIAFKAFQIMIPLIRSDAAGRCGVVDMTV